MHDDLYSLKIIALLGINTKIKLKKICHFKNFFLSMLTFLYLNLKIILFSSSQENQWLSQVIEAQEGHLCVLALTPCWSGGITRIES